MTPAYSGSSPNLPMAPAATDATLKTDRSSIGESSVDAMDRSLEER
jgi:hypothetical protein